MNEMKRIIIALGIVSAAVLSLSGCTEELQNALPEEAAPYTIVANAGETRTVNNGYRTGWAEGDALNVFHAKSGTAEYGANTKFTVSDVASGEFTTSAMSGTLAETNDWYVLYPYEEHVSTPADPKSGYLAVGSQAGDAQVQDGNDNMAHIAGRNYPMWGIAKGVSGDSMPSMAMSHLSSLVKVVVFNRSSENLVVTSVSLEAAEDIVGTYYIDFSSDVPVFTKSGDKYVSKVAKLSVRNGGSIAAGASAEFYFAVKPFTASKDQGLKLSVNGVEKSMQLPSDVTFSSGKVRTLKYNYVQTLEPDDPVVEDGDYVLAFKNGDVFYAMSADEGGFADRRAAVEFEYEGEGSCDVVDPKVIWTVKNAGAYNKFTIRNGDNYLSYASSKAPLSATPYECVFEGTSGNFEYVIHPGASKTSRLYLNTALNSGMIGGFGFYSNKSNTIYVIPVGEDGREQLATPMNVRAELVAGSANSVRVSWDAVANATAYEVSHDALTRPVVTDQLSYVFENLAYETEYVFSVVARDGAAAYRPSDAGEAGVSTGARPEGVPEQSRYVEVTGAPAGGDWSGTYLIAYNDGASVSVLSQISDNIGKSLVLSDEVQADGSIITEDYSCLIEKSTNGYSIKLGDLYLGWVSGNKLYGASSVESEAYEWKIAFSAGEVTITNAKDSSRKLLYNMSSPRFCCYTSAQEGVTLYRLEGSAGDAGGGSDGGSGSDGDSDGEDGGENPPAPDPTPGQDAACGWLELPAKGNVSTASEYVARSGERNYTAYYDTETYSSLWIAYPLAKGHSGSLSRPGSWYYAPGIDEDLQVNLTKSSYKDGYSRGHQIANGDRNGISGMQKQTFYVINSVPQIQNGFNGGIWNALENAIRAEIPSGDSLYVATGPVYRTVGGSESLKYTSAKDDSKKLPVANYFFKVVLKVKRSGSQITDAKAVGFWFEHKVYSGSDYESAAVSVDEIERLTGYDFFANLPDSLEAAAETNTSWTSFCSF